MDWALHICQFVYDKFMLMLIFLSVFLFAELLSYYVFFYSYVE